MLQEGEEPPGAKGRVRPGSPPIPQEHGAWVILYAPMLIAFGLAQSLQPAGWLLLTLALTGAFLARNAAGLLLRKRGREGTGFWLGLYLAVMAAGGLPLLQRYPAWPLILVGLAAGALWCLHSLLLLLPARKRLDRSQWGEILGVSALALTAPAGYIVARGTLDGTAWLLWGICTLYFSGGIFHVKMWLEAAKHKKDWNAQTRWQVGRDSLLYHLLLLAVLPIAALRLPGISALLLALAFAPALFRAFRGWTRLSPQLPPLKRVGILETVYALWFAVCSLASLRCLL